MTNTTSHTNTSSRDRSATPPQGMYRSANGSLVWRSRRKAR